MTQITILSKAPQVVDYSDIARAAAVEAAIVNHCIVNMHFGMDKERAQKLERVRAAAQERFDVLMEILP